MAVGDFERDCAVGGLGVVFNRQAESLSIRLRITPLNDAARCLCTHRFISDGFFEGGLADGRLVWSDKSASWGSLDLSRD